MKLTKIQRARLKAMAIPCELSGWRFGPHSHPYWNSSTNRSLVRRGLIELVNLPCTAGGFEYTAHLCELTDAGRAALQEKP